MLSSNLTQTLCLLASIIMIFLKQDQLVALEPHQIYELLQKPVIYYNKY